MADDSSFNDAFEVQSLLDQLRPGDDDPSEQARKRPGSSDAARPGPSSSDASNSLPPPPTGHRTLPSEPPAVMSPSSAVVPHRPVARTATGRFVGDPPNTEPEDTGDGRSTPSPSDRLPVSEPSHASLVATATTPTTTAATTTTPSTLDVPPALSGPATAEPPRAAAESDGLTPETASANPAGGGAKKKTSSWIPALAGYRALAAFAVLIFHVISIDSRDDFLGRWVVPLGPTAVATFFVLSGYLVYRPFVAWAFGDGPPVVTWKYWARRAARILPVYWVVLTVYLFAIERAGYNFDELLTAYSLTQTFRGSMVFVPPFVAWSLSVELWFSFVLPFIAFSLRWLGNWRPWHHRFRIQLTGLGVMAASAPLFRWWAFQAPGSGRNLWVPAYFDWFAYGLLLAVITHHYDQVKPPRWMRQVADHPWIPLSIGLAAYWATTQIGLPTGFVAPTQFQSHIQYTLQGIVGFMIVSSATLPGSRVARSNGVLASRTFGLLGAWSYGLYLIHDIPIDGLLHWAPDMNRVLMILVVTVVTLAFAVPIHYLVENPVSAFADRQVKRRGAKPTSAATSNAVVPASPAMPIGYLLAPPAAAPPQPDLVVQVPRLATGKFSMRGAIAEAKPFATETWISPNRPAGMTLLAVAASLIATIAAAPGRYVADSRFEMFADPAARLGRMFDLWDPTRDLGRVAEEFWPGLTLVSTLVASIGVENWLHQRLIHAMLLSLAATGAMTLSRTCRPELGWPTLVVGAIYGFGPFSAVYLVPSPLYVSHVVAPWLVVAVLRGANGERTFFWSGLTTLALLAAGNADPPGLVFASIPAGITWLVLLINERAARRRLWAFAIFAGFTTIVGSAAMLVKTSAGSLALSQRLLETESVDVVAATTSFSETIRGMGLWLTLFRLAPVQIRTQQQVFTDDTLGVFISYLPVIAAVVSLIWWRKWYHLLAFSWIIVGTIVASGPHPTDDPSPYGRLLLWLYDNSDVAFGFRSTHKAGSIVMLGVALLGGWAIATVASQSYDRLGWFRWSPSILAILFMAILARPFWQSELYDPAFQSDVAVAPHWEELGEWFEENPPEGRVLVIPGSTNNGYMWGEIGDDLLDPIVPNRVVSSFLPLSTASGADVVKELDDATTSFFYRQGSFVPIAQQLGITHVVIRNDINWTLQNRPQPQALQSFRLDPDIERIVTFGSPADSSVPFSELQVPPVELYSVPVDPIDTLYVPPTDEGSVILIDGSARATIDAAAAGLLDGGHPVRQAPLVDETDEAEVARVIEETPLVILTDSNIAQQRRISYFDYEYRAADADEDPSPWLDGYDEESFVRPSPVGLTIRSTIGEWFHGIHVPENVLDGSEVTRWEVPFFEQSGTLFIEFDEAQPDQIFEFVLVDPAARAGRIRVTVDGRPVTRILTGGAFQVDSGGPFRQVAITVPEGRPGTEPLGIAEIRFQDRQLLGAELPSRIPDMMEAAGSPDIPVALLIGSRVPEATSWQRTFRLWNDQEFDLDAEVVIEDGAEVGRCERDLLSVNGTAIPVRIVEEAFGFGRLSLCGSTNSIDLGAGRHVAELVTPERIRIGQLQLTPKGFALPTVEAGEVEAGEIVAAGGLVLSDFSYDARLRADIGGVAVEPQVLNHQAAFTVPSDGGAFERVYLPTERPFDVAWLVTLLGVGMALLGLIIQPIPRRWLVGSSRMGPASWTRPLALISPVLAIVAAYFIGDIWGVLAALAVTIAARVAPWRVAVGGVAAVAIAMAIVAAVPTLNGGGVDPEAADFLGRMVIGGLIALVTWVIRTGRLEEG